MKPSICFGESLLEEDLRANGIGLRRELLSGRQSNCLEVRRRRLLFSVLTLVLLWSGCATDNIPIAERSHYVELTSSAFDDGAPLPFRHTCEGANVPPPLEWQGVYAPTEFVIAATDGDTEAAYWIVWGISPNVSRIGGESSPSGTEGVNSRGTRGYELPCDRHGTVVFTIFTVDGSMADRGATGRVALTRSLPPTSTYAEVRAAIRCCVRDVDRLTATF